MQWAMVTFPHLHARQQSANAEGEAVAWRALEEVGVKAGVSSNRLQTGTKRTVQAMAQMTQVVGLKKRWCQACLTCKHPCEAHLMPFNSFPFSTTQCLAQIITPSARRLHVPIVRPFQVKRLHTCGGSIKQSMT
jgi:hypothetical protein